MIALSLTFRSATERIYRPSNPGISAPTVRKLRHAANRWERLTDNPVVYRITRQTFADVRTAGLAAKLSPTTVENCVSDVRTILRACVDAELLPAIPSAGRRLRRIERLRPTPSVDDLSRMLKHCGAASWPLRSKVRTEDWWRLLLAAVYFTAQRRGNVLSCPVADMRSESLTVFIKKTGKIITIPSHPLLRKLAKNVPDEVLGGLWGHKQIRNGMARICKAAGIQRWTLQSLRRLSGQAWESARPRAGTAILGHPFRGSDRFYLDANKILKEALPRLEIPSYFGRQNPIRDEPRLLAAFRKLDAREARQAIRLVENLGD